MAFKPTFSTSSYSIPNSYLDERHPSYDDMENEDSHLVFIDHKLEAIKKAQSIKAKNFYSDISQFKTKFRFVDKVESEKAFLLLVDAFFDIVPEIKSVTLTRHFAHEFPDLYDKYPSFTFDDDGEYEYASKSMTKSVYFSTLENDECRPDFRINENGSFSGDWYDLYNKTKLTSIQKEVCSALRNLLEENDSIINEILGLEIIAVIRNDAIEVRDYSGTY